MQTPRSREQSQLLTRLLPFRKSLVGQLLHSTGDHWELEALLRRGPLLLGPFAALMHNWGALIANAAGKSAPPAWSLTITAEKRLRAERKTDSISTWPKLSPACNKSRELATPPGTHCDARFYACNGGTLRSQEQHPHTLRDSSHTNSSAHGRAPGGHEAGGTRRGARGGPLVRLTDNAPTRSPHAAAAEHRPAPQLLRAAVGTPLSAGVTHAC